MSNNKLSTIHCLGMEDALSTAKMVHIKSKGTKVGTAVETPTGWECWVYPA